MLITIYIDLYLQESGDNSSLCQWMYYYEFVSIQPIFSTVPAASKNDAKFKRGQNQLKNEQLALLI